MLPSLVAAPHTLPGPLLFQISLSTQQISVAVPGRHWPQLAMVRSRWVRSSPAAAFGGLPLVVAAVFHGVHSMSTTASADLNKLCLAFLPPCQNQISKR